MTEQDRDRALVSGLSSLLAVAPAGTDIFTGARTPAGAGLGTGRVFGGLVIGQALAAAESTLPGDRPAHSLHAYFLRPGDDTRDIDYRVERDFDGRSFSSRRVVASQEGRPILSLTASFQTAAEGLHHADPMPPVPSPTDLLADEDRHSGKDGEPRKRRWPIELRTVEEQPEFLVAANSSTRHTWMRTRAPLGDDPRIHRAMLAFASDMPLLMTAFQRHKVRDHGRTVRAASLDHALWFHDDFRMDEWLLFVAHSPWAGRARGFVTGQVFTADGRLVASACQEGMIRVTEPPAAT